jgi:hypothetical protein
LPGNQWCIFLSCTKNKWLKNHPASALIFEDPKKVWIDLKPTYETDFKNLVYGNFPDEQELLNTLVSIKKRLSSIEWEIKIEELKNENPIE